MEVCYNFLRALNYYLIDPIRERFLIQSMLIAYVVFGVIWMLYEGFFKLKNYFVKDYAFLLHKAVVEDNKIACLRIMEKHPWAINVPQPPENYTPFLRACLLGNTQIIKQMLKYGADINLTTSKKESCFYLATYYLVKMPNIKDATSIHALYYAGADVNARNEKGYTALHLAAIFGHTSLVRWLLMKGADKNIRPYPYLLAKAEGHVHTASILQNQNRIRNPTLPCLENK